MIICPLFLLCITLCALDQVLLTCVSEIDCLLQLLLWLMHMFAFDGVVQTSCCTATGKCRLD